MPKPTSFSIRMSSAELSKTSAACVAVTVLLRKSEMRIQMASFSFNSLQAREREAAEEPRTGSESELTVKQLRLRLGQLPYFVV